MSATPLQRVRVQIDRGEGRYESFHGVVVGETSSHYQVSWVSGGWTSTGWFAKAGRKVSCVPLDDDLNPVPEES